jgi:hypothetical protein
LDDTTSIEFGEGGEKTPMQWFKGFIDSLPKQVEFSEIKNAHYATAPTADFAVAPGYSVSEGSLDLLGKARAMMAANPGMTLTEAAKAIERG